jgi:hypothetical protein
MNRHLLLILPLILCIINQGFTQEKIDFGIFSSTTVDQFEIRIKPNYTEDGTRYITNAQFTIKWPTASGIQVVSSGTPVFPYNLIPQGPPYSSNGYYYQVWATPGGFTVNWQANQEIVIQTFSFVSPPCPVFEIADGATDNYVNIINGGYYFEVNGLNRTGTLYKSQDQPPSPEQAGTIAGSSSVCRGDSEVTYSIPTINYAVGYSWEYSGTGATIQNNGTLISVNFDLEATSGVLSAKGLNNCDAGGESTMTITVNQLPVVTWNTTLDDLCPNSESYTLTGAEPIGGTYSGPGVSGQIFNSITAGAGTHTITYTYTDGTTGCFDFIENTIVVKDNTPPLYTGTIPESNIEGCSSSDAPSAWSTVAELESMGVTITDDCDPDASLTVTYSDVSTGTCPIDLTRTYTVTDASTNCVTITHTIYILPSALVINNPTDLSKSACDFADQAAVDADFSAWLSSFTVSGGCNPQAGYGTPSAPLLCTGGSVVVTYSVTDLCESGQKSATYTITAPSNPEWQIVDGALDLFLTCNDPVQFDLALSLEPVALDACLGNALVSLISDVSSIDPLTGGATRTRTWSATDACNNTSSPFVQVIYNPVLLTAEVEKTDVSCYGSANGTITISNPQGGSGTYQYRLNNGEWQNSGIFTGLLPDDYTVQIRDGQNPECLLEMMQITLVEPIELTVTCPDDVSTTTDVGLCGALINFSASVTSSVTPEITHTIGGNIITFPYQFATGSSTVLVNATNDCASVDCSFTVTVTDEETPQILCPGTTIRETNNLICSYIVSGIEFDPILTEDNCLVTNISNGLNSGQSLAGYAFEKGSHQIQWYVSDGAGNMNSCSFTLSVLDLEAPVIENPEPLAFNICALTDQIILPQPDISDNCGIYTLSDPGVQFAPGTTTVYWTATDENNNSTTVSQQVTVTLLQAPDANILSNSPVCIGNTIELQGAYQDILCTDGCEMPQGYCNSASNSGDYLYIDHVAFFNGIKPSGPSSYSDNTGTLFTQVYRGNTYPVSISVKNDYMYNYYTSVYIDWNRDGDFGDTGETTHLGLHNGPVVMNVSINVPSNASVGNTRMRIVNRINFQTSPCSLYPIGETEDYLIDIRDLDTEFITSFSWAGPAGFSSNLRNPVITGAMPANSGNYSLTVTASNGCTNVTNTSIIVPDPQPGFGTDYLLTMYPDTIVLTPGIFDSYLWSDGSTVSTIEVINYGVFEVTVTLMGCNATSEITIAEKQDIWVSTGWNIFSTYINTTQSMDQLVSDLEGKVVLVKNYNGLVYFPFWQLNQIGGNVVGAGYLINVSQNSIFSVTGTAIDPTTFPISLNAGANLIGYLKKAATPVTQIFSPYAGNLKILKNDLGYAYWPEYNIDQIGNLLPGEGYYIITYNPFTFSYPASSNSTAKTEIILYEPVYFGKPENTGNNMTLGIPLQAWKTLPETGDEIGVFNQTGELIGSGVFTGESMAMAIWGSDILNPSAKGAGIMERFIIQKYQSSNQHIENLTINTWIEGDGLYRQNTIAIAGRISASETAPTISIESYPNPFTSELYINYHVPLSGKVSVELFDLYGRVVLNILNQTKEAGSFTLKVNLENISNGTYILQIKNNDHKSEIPITKI